MQNITHRDNNNALAPKALWAPFGTRFAAFAPKGQRQWIKYINFLFLICPSLSLYRQADPRQKRAPVHAQCVCERMHIAGGAETAEQESFPMSQPSQSVVDAMRLPPEHAYPCGRPEPHPHVHSPSVLAKASKRVPLRQAHHGITLAGLK